MHSANLETGIQRAASGVFLGVDNLLCMIRAGLGAEGETACALAPMPVAADAAVG